MDERPAKRSRAVLVNMWSALPLDPPYVLAEDRPHVEAWNERRGAKDERVRLQLSVWPEPFLGPRTAHVVILAQNPAWPGGPPPHVGNARYEAALRGNLSDDSDRHIHMGLQDAFAATSGKWWRPRWRVAMERSGLTFEDMARKVLAVQSHGYFSERWARLPVTLPSQWFSFDLVRQAVERSAVIVVTRGWKDWTDSVPELQSYDGAMRTKSPRGAYVTPMNLPAGGFERVVDALNR
jgi:hypothetical protein